ncbi:hypothetical protein P3T35_002393 [Kitasatospora sp. GP30]|uniref:hypothetical protein n=1 Tax=Kitasatospora sp. GP30 TaxID=3035084 RepID=UPI000C706A5D|nr:hypothetical protein [Kitasatospora sp. GP30]MDH6140385.1 hypothetical protein [Kitasatospora sp. GP30]
MVIPGDLVGRRLDRVACSWLHARGPSDALELLHMWLTLDGLRVRPADQHAGVYTVRIEHTRANDIETIGLPESVSALRALGERPVRLEAIDSPDRCWHFALFLADGGSLVGCAGVRRSGAAA